MGFLLTEILILLTLAAASSAALVYFLMRRRFVDVTVDYLRLETQGSTMGKELEAARAARLSAETQLATMKGRCDALSTEAADQAAWRRAVDRQLAALSDGVTKMPSALAPLDRRVGEIAQAVTRLPKIDAIETRLTKIEAALSAQRPVDLVPILRRIDTLEATIPRVDGKALLASLGELQEGVQKVSLEPLIARQAELGQRIGAQIAGLEGLLAELRPADQGSLAARLGEIERLLLEPRSCDQSAVLGRVADLKATLQSVEATDLAPLTERLAGLEALLRNLRQPDLSPLEQAISAQRPVDLGPLVGRIAAIEELIAAQAPRSDLDLSPLIGRVASIEELIAAQAPRCNLDLSPLTGRIDALEALLAELQEAQRAPKRAPKAAPPVEESPREEPTTPPPPLAEVVRPGGSSNLLIQAAFGRPDDLKRIRGVAEVLERMLHKIGVYYFWQIAEWTEQDVEFADAQLERFKGRIQRDDWVGQARQFCEEPGAARRPLS